MIKKNFFLRGLVMFMFGASLMHGAASDTPAYGSGGEKLVEADLPHIINMGGPIYFRVKGSNGREVLKPKAGALQSLAGFEGIYKLEGNQSITFPSTDSGTGLRFRIWPAFIENLDKTYLEAANREGKNRLEAISLSGWIIKNSTMLIIDNLSKEDVVRNTAKELAESYPSVSAVRVQEIHPANPDSLNRAILELNEARPGDSKALGANIFTIWADQKHDFDLSEFRQALIRAVYSRVYYRAFDKQIYRTFDKQIAPYANVANF